MRLGYSCGFSLGNHLFLDVNIMLTAVLKVLVSYVPVSNVSEHKTLHVNCRVILDALLKTTISQY